MIALACLALAMKIIVPPGFMLDSPRSGQGVALVICTGHGPLTLYGAGHDAPGQKSKAGAPCAAFGNTVSLTPLDSPLPVRADGSFLPAANVARADQLPGRGLAAPPPPALGPPRLI